MWETATPLRLIRAERNGHIKIGVHVVVFYVLTHQFIVFIVGRKLNGLFHGMLAALTTFRLWFFKLYGAKATNAR